MDTIEVIEVNLKSSLKRRCLIGGIVAFIILLAATITTFVIFFIGEEPQSLNGDLQKYVLPNTTVTVLEDTNSSIKGECIVNEIRYEFASISRTLTFKTMDDESIDGVWSGFTLNNEDESILEMNLFALNDSVYTIEFVEDLSVNTNLLEVFMKELLAEHYVEMTVKLGSMGYIGTNGQHIQNLHRFAKWIWQYEATEDAERGVIFQNDEWEDISEEFEKVNAIVSASNNAGFWVRTMDNLLTHISEEQPGRALLGSCGSPYTQCGDTCYGRCGPGCDCWSWFCGDCNCWDGCAEHDYYCACKSMFDFWCVNVFWIYC